MNLLEGLLTIGNSISSAYCATNGHNEVAIISGAVVLGLVLSDVIPNYFNQRQQKQIEKKQAEWDFDIIKLRQRIY